MTITADNLLNGDRSVLFKINPGDDETPAMISVADLKELALAINVVNERVLELLKDVERAEKRIEKLEQRLDTIPEYGE